MSYPILEQHGIRLTWRDREGRLPEKALYLGGLCVGRLIHTEWVVKHHLERWRVWIMTSESGKEIGWYATKQEAMDALVDAVLKAMFA